MASDSGEEKTEEATPKRKRDERKKGNVFTSKDLTAAFFILGMFAMFKILANIILKSLSQSMTYWVGISGTADEFFRDGTYATQVLLQVCRTTAIAAGPLLLIGIAINVLLTGAQTRFIFSMEPAKFKMSRLNPIEGIKKMFSLRTVVELLKSLLKIAVIFALVKSEIEEQLPTIMKLPEMELMQAVGYVCSVIFSISMTIGMVFVFIGIVDLLYQWYDHNKNLKMTKQEVKEEYKQMEGDPQIKGKIKQKQREMAQQRMMQDVPKADVVIRNPTHYAVAVKYDPEKNRAPMVVAKGADNIAMKIIEIAKENDVTMVENRPLARSLYDKIDIGREITPDFYQQVAEILAFVYDLKNKRPPFGNTRSLSDSYPEDVYEHYSDEDNEQ